MRARNGQVALYLVMVLVAICIFVVMNVGAYLAVAIKNRTMNAGDSAALAVANAQGRLLNAIGQCNIDHLQAALDNDEDACGKIMENQARLCFLGPLKGFEDRLGRVDDFIKIGNDYAQKNGIGTSDEEAFDTLWQHAIDIRTGYAMDVEQFPEPWEGAWGEYATALEIAIGNGLYASPDNIDFVDAAGGHLLLNYQFYNAIAGWNWCWFHFNAPGLLDSYGSFRDWGPLPAADDETRKRRCVNSEIYSLHLEARTGSALQLFGEGLIRNLTGCSEADIRNSFVITNQAQVWYCYDRELWRNWWEIDPDGDWNFPVTGKVKPEYDVRGCAACCRVRKDIPDVLGLGESRVAADRADIPESEYVSRKTGNLGEDAAEYERFEDRGTRVCRWTAAAKPFGTVENEDGDADVVTALGGRLVAPSFSDARLVPWDAVGGRDTERPNLDMVTHIRKHLPKYLDGGGVAALSPGCYYCQQLREWERDSLRKMARDWLRYNSRSCIRATSGGSRRGGTPHGH